MEDNKEMNTIYDNIIEQIKEIDPKDLRDNVDQTPSMKTIEGQKIYFWIRLYLKEDIKDIEEGDMFDISYRGTETLKVQFIAFGKKNLVRDMDDDIVNYDPEDDKKCLCLMVNETRVKKESDDIPFIRTLFKTSPFYEYQLYKRSELTFTNTRTESKYEYIDVDF
jgi:hypothetical protein